jgi:3-isopropylmalate dehydrogenase
MKPFRIALLPGDGAGGEVVAQAVKALGALERRFRGLRFELTEVPWDTAAWAQSGVVAVPAEVVAACSEQEAVLAGYLSPASASRSAVRQDSPRPLQHLAAALECDCTLRELNLFHGTDSPLRGYAAGSLNMLLAMENPLELWTRARRPLAAEAQAAEEVICFRRQRMQRVLQVAFEQALRRRKSLLLADGSQLLPASGMMAEEAASLGPRYPMVRVERRPVEAVVSALVRRPHAVDTITADGLHAGVIAEAAAAVVGGAGVVGAAELGARTAIFHSVEPSDDEPPRRGVANPTGCLLSVAMMLGWLGTPDASSAGTMLRVAMARVLKQSQQRTRDLGGPLTTGQLGDAIARAVAEQ